MTDKLLTVDEAARLKGVTVAAIYAAVKELRLPHTRVLGRIGLKHADVLQWTPRGYRGRPGAKSGRPKGIPVTNEVKTRISIAQKRRWAERKSGQNNDKSSSLFTAEALEQQTIRPLSEVSDSVVQ